MKDDHDFIIHGSGGGSADEGVMGSEFTGLIKGGWECISTESI